ncbi:16S rRNA (cytidine(1402)-2'-O)-methyltransferase [Candidatus Izimaplasma bacterium]|nr:16S rRNA (cytidine(1402)-2'-O)-methyltransferase [Candidatus Izimaplasma bacterium]
MFKRSSTLYLVATPIGNLEDMTFRAVKILKEVDIIYCEDTRVSGTLLHHYEIKKPLKTYHDFNKKMKSEDIINNLKDNKNVALISDAGYPLISDPGYYVIREVIKHDFNVVSIPGANALLSAVVTSGIPPHPFMFYGFLDAKETKRRKELERFKDHTETLIFYESPHRINKTIKSMYEVLGERDLVIARELTKKFEEIIRGTTISLQDITDIKGEMVLVIEGKRDVQEVSNLTVLEEVNQLIEEGLTSKEAIKQVAKNRNIPKNDVYMEYHK